MGGAELRDYGKTVRANLLTGTAGIALNGCLCRRQFPIKAPGFQGVSIC
jgi:hypothetical protein